MACFCCCFHPFWVICWQMRSRVYQLSGGYASWNPHWGRLGWCPRSTSVAVWRLQSGCRVGQQDGKQRATRVSLQLFLSKTLLFSIGHMHVCWVKTSIVCRATLSPFCSSFYLYPSLPSIHHKNGSKNKKRNEHIFPVRTSATATLGAVSFFVFFFLFASQSSRQRLPGLSRRIWTRRVS